MQEQNFRPNYNINYRRGQVILVDFGYRIGSELGVRIMLLFWT